MPSKYILKISQPGQAATTSVLTPGMGQAAKGLVLRASDATRYHLFDAVTQASPARLSMKRVGPDLHLHLPGSDTDAVADMVIQDFFVAGAVLQGSPMAGGLMVYDTTALLGTAAVADASGWSPTADAAGADTGAATLVRLQEPATTALSLWDSSLGLAAVFGSVALATVTSSAGSATTSNAPTDPLEVLKAYTNDAAAIKSAATPTLSTYRDLGLRVLASLSDTSDNARVDPASGSNTLLSAAVLNSALDQLDGSTLSLARVQAMADSYFRILSEADGKVANTDVYPGTADADPLASDYANIGITVANAIGSATTQHTLNLLNDAVGRVASASSTGPNTKVDTVGELRQLATTANDVMLLAKGSAASQVDADLVKGLNALVDGTDVTTANLAAVKTTVAATADDGSGADTFASLQSLVNGAIGSFNTVQALADGNHATNAAPLPTVNDYANLGLTVSSVSNGSNTVSQATVLSLLNDVVSGLSGTQVDTAAELASLGSAVTKIMTMAANSKTSGATTADYTGLTQADLGLLGLKGNDGVLASTLNVAVTDLQHFNQSLIQANTDTGAVVDTFAELQSLLSNVITANAAVVLG